MSRRLMPSSVRGMVRSIAHRQGRTSMARKPSASFSTKRWRSPFQKVMNFFGSSQPRCSTAERTYPQTLRSSIEPWPRLAKTAHRWLCNMNLSKGEVRRNRCRAGRQVRPSVSEHGGSGYGVSEIQPIVHLKLTRQQHDRAPHLIPEMLVARSGRPVGLPWLALAFDKVGQHAGKKGKS